MASVTLRRLTKTYQPGTRPVLEELSLEIGDGEFFVLLGPSACGQTTLLRCIAGLEEPSAGEILIGERDVTHVPPGARDVAMVFQTHALYPHLTVRGNIGFGLAVRGVAAPEIARRVGAAATRLGLAAALDRLPGELSGGERLSLHRALQTTVVYVTHDQTDAIALGHRIAVLEGGRLRQLGTPAEVYGRPADVFVARFLGNPGMNILKGRGRGARGGGAVVDCGAWSLAVPLEDYEGEIHLGVRPEHVGLCAPDQGTGVADVRVVEQLGAETLVYLDAGG